MNTNKQMWWFAFGFTVTLCLMIGWSAQAGTSVQAVRTDASGGVVVNSRDGTSQSVLSGPIYEFDELSVNISVTGDIAELTKSNLVIGQYYRVTTHWMFNGVGSGEAGIIETQHGGDVLITDRIVVPTVTAASMLITIGSTRIFRATTTTVEFDLTSITGTIEIVGGSDAQSYVQLEKVNGYKETIF